MTSDWSNDSDLGATSYASADYTNALTHYSNALDKLKSDVLSEVTADEKKKQHQILLSNVIACRLKIGGEDMVDLALEEAKEVS